VRDVSSNSTTNTTSNLVNPQNGSTFTWLSALATRFEMFKFSKLRLLYKPSCGTSYVGFVIIGMDFDAYDTAPTKVTMLAWRYSSKCAVWQECSVDCSTDARLSTWRYCDTNSDRGDLRLDTLGVFWSLAYGTGSDAFVGELFVDYTVHFRMPSYKIPPALYFTASAPDSGSHTVAGGSTSGNLAVVVSSDSVLVNEAGRFVVSYLQQATSGLSTAPIVTFTDSEPSAKHTNQFISNGNSSTRNFVNHYLDILVPPVTVSVSAALGVGASGLLNLATFAGDKLSF